MSAYINQITNDYQAGIISKEEYIMLLDNANKLGVDCNPIIHTSRRDINCLIDNINYCMLPIVQCFHCGDWMLPLCHCNPICHDVDNSGKCLAKRHTIKHLSINA